VIYGAAGNDLIKVTFGNEEVHGGADDDTLSFAEIKTDLVFDLATGSSRVLRRRLVVRSEWTFRRRVQRICTA
jgi:hypothetical protein